MKDADYIKEHYNCFQAVGVAQRIFDGKKPISFDEYCKRHPIPTKENNYNTSYLIEDRKKI